MTPAFVRTAAVSGAVAVLPLSAVAGPNDPPVVAQVDEEADDDHIDFPEEGGALPRAPIPEGRAPDAVEGQPTRRPTPESGVEDELPRAEMPEGRAPEGRAPASRPRPLASATSTAAPTPAPRGAPSDAPPASGARPRGLASPPTLAPATDAPAGREPTRKFGDFADGLARDYGLRISWNGYLRLVMEAIENDDRSVFIGRNDGFKIANARLGLRAGKGDFYAYISVDAAVGERETFNDPNQEFAVRPRDLFLRYRLADFASITVGRFKAPYDLGQLEATAYRVFIDLPLESRGVLPTQGLEVEGLGQGRQLGAMIHRDRVGFDRDGFDLGYAIALTNGRTLGLALNDNDRVAGFARLSLYWSDLIQINVAGFLDNRTVGELPDLFDEDVRGLEVSALLQAFGFSLEGQLLYQGIAFESEVRPDVDTFGVHGQIAYTYGGFQVAYRYAYYDPINADDAVTEHTAGIAYALSNLPLRLVLNGTLSLEEASVRVDNNRLAFLTQFVF